MLQKPKKWGTGTFWKSLEEILNILKVVVNETRKKQLVNTRPPHARGCIKTSQKGISIFVGQRRKTVPLNWCCKSCQSTRCSKQGYCKYPPGIASVDRTKKEKTFAEKQIDKFKEMLRILGTMIVEEVI